MKYHEFENKPFGLFTLFYIIITWIGYVFLCTLIFMSKEDLVFKWLISSLLTALHWLLQSIVTQSPYDFIGRRKSENQISVVVYVYENFWKATWKIISLFIKGLTELIFRRYYLRLYHFVINLNTLADKMESKVDEFKSQNDKLID